MYMYNCMQGVLILMQAFKIDNLYHTKSIISNHSNCNFCFFSHWITLILPDKIIIDCQMDI